MRPSYRKSLFRRTRSILWGRIERYAALLGLLVIVSRPLMDSVLKVWEGFPWWVGVLLLGFLLSYALVRAGYELWKEEQQAHADTETRLRSTEQEREQLTTKLRATERERDAFREENEDLIEEIEAQPPSLKSLAPDALANRHLKGQPIHIADLARNETRIRGWTFEDCTIYGPTVIATLGGTHIYEPTWTADKAQDILYVADRDRWEGVIGLQDCTLRRCTFVRVGLLVKPEEYERIKAGMEGQDGS